jgi:hypothetical protein
MKLKQRRSGSGSRGAADPLEAARKLAHAPGTVLGWFFEERQRVEVVNAGECRVWLRTWRPDRNGPIRQVDLGPITWDDYRTPSLEPVPNWLDTKSSTAFRLVGKSMVIVRAVRESERIDPAYEIAINPALRHLLQQSQDPRASEAARLRHPPLIEGLHL